MKTIVISEESIGPGVRYLGWSGRGWSDGGPASAGPLSSQAPSWDSYSQEIGINMVRVGFTIRHFLPDTEDIQLPLADHIKRGLENNEVSWAKGDRTSYSYSLQRCQDLGWKCLVCINPSYKSYWSPNFIIQSSEHLKVWKDFCFHLAKYIEETWPGITPYFEVTNEPDIGYFDGESFLPGYQGPTGGISPAQYSDLLQSTREGIKQAVPDAQIIGPGIASWDRSWLEELFRQNSSCLDGFSYHNVCGNLNDQETLEELKQALSAYSPQAANLVFNSEWAWWPNHDINSVKTALRIAQILYFQTVGSAYGSLYLGPAQPKEYKRGLGVLQFPPDDPNDAEKTKSFYAFRLMSRGVLGGELLKSKHTLRKIHILALLSDKKGLVITLINPSKRRFGHLSIRIDESIKFRKESFLKRYQLDNAYSDSFQRLDISVLKRFHIGPESIIQFVIELNKP